MVAVPGAALSKVFFFAWMPGRNRFISPGVFFLLTAHSRFSIYQVSTDH
jgi:hypothetical protein